MRVGGDGVLHTPTDTDTTVTERHAVRISTRDKAILRPS